MTVDFSEMHPQVPSPLNSGRSGGIAAARVAFKALTSPELDVNEGCFRPLNVVLPEGTMLSAKPPAALGRWSIALPTVIDTILKALAPAVPHLIPAAHKGDMGGCSFFGFRADGSRFLLMNIFGGGWGGRPDEDGESASVSVCQGDVRNTPVELQEIKYPVMIERHALRSDSAGAGRFRGGLGLEVTYRMLQTCKANINCERTVDPPWGLHGGKSAATNAAIIRRAADGSEEIVYKATEIEIAAGDTVTFLTAGGGGYGNPHARAPEAVAYDIAAGVVSLERSARDYQSPQAGASATAVTEPAE
jgi:N-methylhydantoinase B